jgi:hypothetical protein
MENLFRNYTPAEIAAREAADKRKRRIGWITVTVVVIAVLYGVYHVAQGLVN